MKDDGPIIVDRLKDQLLISLMKRVMTVDGNLVVPVSEVIETEDQYVIIDCDTRSKQFLLTLGYRGGRH
jgi:hypothetical protein